MSKLYRKFLKRIFDFLTSLLGLIFLFPLFVVIGILIKLEDGGSVFYRQERVGQNWKIFKIYKFRTMVEGADKMGSQVTRADDPRITRIGKFLRRYKLDELPQLINVVKGEMSLVGPRPEVLKYAKAYKDDYDEILQVKPGITDFASLEFKDESEILKGARNVDEVYLKEILPRKVKLYKKYLKEMSFITDLKLIFRTIRGILPW